MSGGVRQETERKKGEMWEIQCAVHLCDPRKYVNVCGHLREAGAIADADRKLIINVDIVLMQRMSYFHTAHVFRFAT